MSHSKNQNRRNFHFDPIKIFVLNSAKISGMFSGQLPTGIFNQLSDPIFDEKIILRQIRVDLVKSICKIN